MIEEPTAIWLQMSCIATRYGLPPDVKKDFNNRYKDAIDHPPTSQTAGRLARFFAMFMASQVNYSGRATQERLFLKYLRRAESLPWAEHDLCDVCQFLWMLPKDQGLRDGFITSGVNRFPDCPRLQLLAGELEMDRGPFACNFRTARFHMQRALQLARDSRCAEDETIVERAQRALAMLDGTERNMPPFMFGDEDEQYDDDDEDDDEDGDEFDEDFEFEEGYDGPLEELASVTQADLDRFFAALKHTMPPEVLETLKQVAAVEGIHPMELLREIVENGPNELFGEAGGERKRRRHGKKSTRKRW